VTGFPEFPNTTFEKSIAVEQNHIRTELQFQPTKYTTNVEIAKETLFGQPPQRIKDAESK
jgi:hypothetical protein